MEDLTTRLARCVVALLQGGSIESEQTTAMLREAGWDPAAQDFTTSPVPREGWRCFHCNEVFHTERTAREHFTAAPTLPPECLDARSPARKLARRARVAELARRRAEAEVETADYEIASLRSELASLRRQLKVKPGSNITHEIDFLQGRVIAAEAVVGYIQHRFPLLVQKARDNV